MKRYLSIGITSVIIIGVLAAAFFLGGDGGETQPAAGQTAPTAETVLTASSAPSALPSPEDEAASLPSGSPSAAPQDGQSAKETAPAPSVSSAPQEQANEAYSREQGMEIDEQTGKDPYQTEPVPVGQPAPVEPQEETVTQNELSCTLSVRCDSVLSHLDRLDPEKAEILPQDGVMLPPTEVVFYEGESVFHVLLREMKKNKIHFEFVNTPVYNSAYIEGIANLYEFDCGPLSGWMYRVNGWYPNYGCSRYALKAGDQIDVLYTCDLGKDIGGYNDLSGER